MKIGDYVNVLPYNKFDNHIGISEISWNNIVLKNPHKIQFINSRNVMLEDSCFAWDITMVEPYKENVIIPDIIDMV